MSKTGTPISASASADARDLNQRSMGFVGLSAIAHVGVLLAVLLAPSFRTQTGGAIGAQAGTEVEYAGDVIADPSAPSASSDSAPTEVLLAEPSDDSAVEMPAQKSEPTTPPEPVAAKPVASKPVVVAKPKVFAAKQPALQTSNESDVEIKSALEKARSEKVAAVTQVETPEKQEDLPAELDAPVMETEPVTAKNEVPETETAVAEETPTEAAAPTEAPEVPASAPIAKAAPTSPAAQPAATEAAAPSTTSGSTSALQAPNANGAGTLGRSGGGDSPTLGSNGAGPKAAAPGVGAGSAIRDASDLVAMPGNPKPSYPLQDKMAGKQGLTVLVGQVKADGTVSNVAVEKSSGSFQMDRAAAQAFAKWRFRPGQAGKIRSPFQFQLVGDAKEVPARLRTQ